MQGRQGRGASTAHRPATQIARLGAEGRLVLCQHRDRRVTRIEPDGTRNVLSSRYMGKRLNSPNDLVFKSNGDLYFTDPPYGLQKNWDDPARELDFCGVYRVSAKNGTLTLLTKEMSRPNGIAVRRRSKPTGRGPWASSFVTPSGVVNPKKEVDESVPGREV